MVESFSSVFFGPALTGFQAAVALVQRAGEVIGDALEVVFLGALEKVANVIVQPALILLHRQQIVGLSLNDLPGYLPLAAHGVDGDDATGENIKTSLYCAQLVDKDNRRLYYSQ